MHICLSFKCVRDFELAKESISFFCKILESSTQKMGLKSQITLNESELRCVVSLQEDNLLSLAKMLEEEIPYSLFVTFDKMESLEDFVLDGEFITATSCNYLTPKEIQSITQNDNFCDLWQDFYAFKQGELQLITKDNTPVKITDKAELNAALEQVTHTLLQGGSVGLESVLGDYELSLCKQTEKVENAFCIMPFDLATCSLLCVGDKECFKVLASIEKPMLEVRLKGIFEELLGKSSKIILPYEPLLFLLCAKLQTNTHVETQGFIPNVLALSTPLKKDTMLLAYKVLAKKPYLINVAQNTHKKLLFTTKTQQTLPSLPSYPLGLFESMQKENFASLPIGCLYVGNLRSGAFIARDFKDSVSWAMKFSFEIYPTSVFENIQKDEVGATLLKNFKKNFTDFEKALETLPSHSLVSDNLCDLIGICGMILELDLKGDLQNFSTYKLACNRVLQNSLEFLGKKAPRIDYRLIKLDNGEVTLDILRTIRSVMSFMLAGVERELIAFGIVDSLAEFFANLAQDLGENYGVKSIFCAGSLFGYRRFLEQFVLYYAKDNLYFPCESLDYTI